MPLTKSVLLQLCEHAQKWANHLAVVNEFYYRSAKNLGQNLFCCPCSALVTDLTGKRSERGARHHSDGVFHRVCFYDAIATDRKIYISSVDRSRGSLILVQYSQTIQLFQRQRLAAYERECGPFYTNGVGKNEVLWRWQSHLKDWQNICGRLLLSSRYCASKLIK